MRFVAGKKRIMILLSFCLVFQFVLLSAPQQVFAGDGICVLDEAGNQVTSFAVEDRDVTAPLIKAFFYTRAHASADRLLTIRVPQGEYDVSKGITLSSYTTLDLQDVTLYNANAGKGNIFLSPRVDADGKICGGYAALVHFLMLGGTLDYAPGNQNGSCLMRIAHGDGLLFSHVSFLNNYNSHHVEIAACRNTVFDGCTFSGQTSDYKKSSSEALQIDILEEQSHFSGFSAYDGTMNQNITVKNCTFRNVVCGVGTRSAFVGKYQKNITITRNRFEGIGAAAIVCTNFIHAKITDNTIKNAGMGISYYMKKSTGSYSKHYNKNGTLDWTKNTDCASEIAGNTVSVQKKQNVSQPRAIYVYGGVYDGSAYPKGDYRVYKLKIAGNTLSSSGGAISAVGMDRSVVTGNRIVHSGAYSETTVGICLNASDRNKVRANRIAGFDQDLKCYKGADDNQLSSNCCSAARASAVCIQDANKNTLHANTVSNSRSNGIYIKNAKKTVLTDNRVQGCKGSGIYVSASSASVQRSKLKNNGKYGIYADSRTRLICKSNQYSTNQKGKRLLLYKR